MSAEVLRRAASLMRERAEAVPVGPWEKEFSDVIRSDVSFGGKDYLIAETTTVERAAHMASWHPVVALAVADWLDDEADNLLPDTIADQIGLGATPEDAASMAEILHAPAVAVARAYLGASS